MRPPALRPLRPEILTLILSLLFVLLLNQSLWQRMLVIVPPLDGHSIWMLTLTALLVTAFFNLLLLLLAWPWVFKPLLIVLLLTSAGASYFMQQYGVLIDVNMVQNVFQTDPAEVRDLITLRMVLMVLVLGVLPSILLWKIPVKYRPAGREVLARLLALVVTAAVLAGVALAGYQDFASLFRNHRDLRYLLTPNNYIQATSTYLRHNSTPDVIQPYASDARRLSFSTLPHKKRVLVLVVGETARADRFSLNGYARNTNPELSQIPGLINFSDVSACGTETAVSLPCMLSGMTRENYDAGTAKKRENLLDIVQRSGYGVLWRNNNSGCKGTCLRMPIEDMAHLDTPGLCNKEECGDEILLQGLPEKLAAAKGDMLIVLHQKGSHGPAYYKRYPKQFEVFKPVCRSSELQKCSAQEIGNAFDNTILYTDHFLARTIALLQQQKDVDSAMIYISDHGESLGENNIYLHGTPYFMAPEAQYKVPMLMWFSDGYQKRNAVNTQCLSTKKSRSYSQDNLFHSVLGLLDISTSVYRQQLDLFAACRRPAPVKMLST
ncbi:phosphoethanolamine transferase [Craterilacuibacter sp.]|uniref:phosphoethanolamine transferase n=1 Tax=Craterilacuibacter sp. TaxID=2870909 RepID=UPI003F3DCEEF